MRVILVLLLAMMCGACSSSDSTTASDATSNVSDSTDNSTDTETPDAASNLAEGSTCAAATECTAGLICVFKTLQADNTTCVDPKIGVYDDGTDPKKQLENAGKGWLRKRVGDWKSKNLTCNDGSPYGYYISPGSGDGANKWIIFFKGGGTCSTQEACAVRWAIQANYMRQWRTVNKGYTPGNRETMQTGIYSNVGRQEGKFDIPNALKNWTVVHLHYCSSDTFIGTSTADENSLRFPFRGKEIVKAVVQELLKGFDTTAVGKQLPRLASATHVIIAGGSAGAVGARHNMDMIADMIKADGRDSIVVRGVADSVVIPPIAPQSYELGAIDSFEVWKSVYDLDCMTAHGPDNLGLCSDSIHLITGRGRGVHHGIVDSGHLGVPDKTETHGIKDLFIFMATRDGKTTPHLGNINICVRKECSKDSDCAPGQGCLSNVCLTVEPCKIAYCTPGLGADPASCLGVGDAPSCMALVASHKNICDESASCPGDSGCCNAGEQCKAGYCIEDKYLGCKLDSDCAPDGFCGRGICQTASGENNSCPDGYSYERDTGTCDQVIGCSAKQACGENYSCMIGQYTPWAQRFQWGLTDEMRGLGPKVGVYIVDSPTHTVISGDKHYGVYMPRLDGHVTAEAFNLWVADASTYKEHITRMQDLPLSLWAWDISDLKADGITARTTGSGCANDAIGLLICDVDSTCDAPSKALAILSIGDTGTKFTDGQKAPETGVKLKIVLRLNPKCKKSPLDPGRGAFITMQYQYGSDAKKTASIKVSIPGGSAAAKLLKGLYIGAAGSLFEEAEMKTLVSPRRE